MPLRRLKARGPRMKPSDRSLRGRDEANRRNRENLRSEGNQVESRTHVLVCACDADDAQLMMIYSDRMKITYLPSYNIEEVRGEIETSSHELILCGVDAFLEAFPPRPTNVSARAREKEIQTTTEAGISPFARRELSILAMVAKGQTNDEIAKSLYLSSRTVKRVLSSLYERLQVSNRTELAARVTGISLLENDN
jgi:DNA-binding NarL/FixJ family response regulator